MSLEAFDDALANAQLAEVQRLAAAHTADAIRALVVVCTATDRALQPNADGYFEVVLEVNGEPKRFDYLPGPRVAASKALLEHAHGRPTQRVVHEGDSGSKITVVLHTFGPGGEPNVIDITPTPERIGGGADPPSERMDAA